MASLQAPGPPPQWQPLPGPPSGRRPGNGLRWIASAGVLFGLVGIALGATALISRPTVTSTSTTISPPAPSYTSQEVDAAKKKICAKFTEVKTGVEKNRWLEAAPGPNKELYDYTASVQARLALVAGAQSLTTNIEPAVPKNLAEATEILAAAYLDKATATLAGMSSQDPGWQSLDLHETVAKTEVERLCT